MIRATHTGPTFVTRAEAERVQTTPSPLWAPPQGALPAVLVHLTSLAPALDGIDLSDDRRWRWMPWVTPGQATRRTLMRLDRRADQVSLRTIDGLDGVEVHDGAPPFNGCERLLAIIFDVPPAAVRTAWASLMPSARIEDHAIGAVVVLTLQLKDAA